jgi:succinate dehydrogenase/fumarate reductase flavoprotein subunit
VADNSFYLAAVGGGFAGLVAALSLRWPKAEKNIRLSRIAPILFSQGSP